MQPRINADHAFDQNPLLLFTSETSVAFPKAWERRSFPSTLPNPMRESNGRSPRRRGSNSMQLLLAAAASLVAGIVIGFAGGYASAQRIGTLLATMLPPSRNATAEVSTTSPAAAASIEAPDSKRVIDPIGALSQPSDGAPAWRPEADSGRAIPEPPGALPVPEVSTPATRRASIEVSSSPAGAVVALDGRIVGRTPLAIGSVREGTHVIGMELPGFNRWATSVHVRGSERTRVAARLSP